MANVSSRLEFCRIERAPEFGPAGAVGGGLRVGEGAAGGDDEVGGEAAHPLDRDHLEFRAGVRSLLADQRLAAQAALSRCRGWPVATPPERRATCGNCSATSGV